MLRFFTRLIIIASGLAHAAHGLADELPRTRWQILPLTELFYTEKPNSQGTHIVTAAFDLPCGASPLGVFLADRGDKLQVAAMVVRPLVACARLPERRYFKMPFVDSTAYKVIEPMRGDLDGIRATELGVASAKNNHELNVDVPCGVIAAGLLVMPAAEKSFHLAAVGFKLPPRRVTAACPGADFSGVAPAVARSVVTVSGLVKTGQYRVLPRKVADVRKLGVLQLRGIKRLDLKAGKVHFERRCYEVPVGIAVVPRRGGQAIGVAMASYINAPCLARQAKVSASPLIEETLAIAPAPGQVGRTAAAAAGSTWDLQMLSKAHVLTPQEIKKYQLGQLLLASGTLGDISGVVVTAAASSAQVQGRRPPTRGWFAFVARSGGNGGRFALQAAGMRNSSPTNLASVDPLVLASRVGRPAGVPRITLGERPLRLQITSAL